MQEFEPTLKSAPNLSGGFGKKPTQKKHPKLNRKKNHGKKPPGKNPQVKTQLDCQKDVHSNKLN